MFRFLSLRRIPLWIALFLGASFALGILLFLSTGFLANAQSVLSDPALEDYRQIDRLYISGEEAPTAESEGPGELPPEPLREELPVESAPIAPSPNPSMSDFELPGTVARPDAEMLDEVEVLSSEEIESRERGMDGTAGMIESPDTPDMAATREDSPVVGWMTGDSGGAEMVHRTEDIPLCAVIDLKTDTLEPDGVKTLSQLIWNALERAGRCRLMRLDSSRLILARRDLTPTDPYRAPPTRAQMADALNADFLLVGNVNKFADVYVLELQLYSKSADAVLKSENTTLRGDFGALLEKADPMVQELIKLIPKKRLVPAAHGKSAAPDDPFAASEDGMSSREKILSREIAMLRMENDRLRKQLRGGAPEKAEANNADAAQKDAGRIRADGLRELEPVQGPRRKMPVSKKTRIAPWSVGLGDEEVSAANPSDMSETTTNVADAGMRPSPSPTLEPTPVVTPEPTPDVADPTPTPAVSENPVASEEEQKEAKAFYAKAKVYPADSRDALPLLEDALKLDPTNLKYQTELIKRFYYCGMFSECARRGQLFARQQPADADTTYLNLYVGAAYYELGDFRNALQAAERILRKEPENPYALYNRALNLYMLNDSKASNAFRDFLDQVSDDPSPDLEAKVKEARERLRRLESENTI